MLCTPRTLLWYTRRLPPCFSHPAPGSMPPPAVCRGSQGRAAGGGGPRGQRQELPGVGHPGEMELPRPKPRASLTASRDSLSLSEKGGGRGRRGEGGGCNGGVPCGGESKEEVKSPVRINGTVAYCSQQVGPPLP